MINTASACQIRSFLRLPVLNDLFLLKLKPHQISSCETKFFSVYSLFSLLPIGLFIATARPFLIYVLPTLRADRMLSHHSQSTWLNPVALPTRPSLCNYCAPFAPTWPILSSITLILSNIPHDILFAAYILASSIRLPPWLHLSPFTGNPDTSSSVDLPLTLLHPLTSMSILTLEFILSSAEHPS